MIATTISLLLVGLVIVPAISLIVGSSNVMAQEDDGWVVKNNRRS